MRMFIISKNKYLSNDMKIFETCSIPLSLQILNGIVWTIQEGIWPQDEQVES